MKIETWLQLKEFCNTLTDEQLNAKVQIDVVEHGTKERVYASIMDDDYLINSTDNDDQGLRQDYETGAHLMEGEENDFDEDNYIVFHEKGMPVMSCDN